MTYIELWWLYLYCIYGTVCVLLFCFFYYEAGNKNTMKVLVVLISLLSIVKSQSKYLFTCRVRRVWRYNRGNQESVNRRRRRRRRRREKKDTTQWPKKGQKDKHRSTKHTHKTKDRITQTPLKTECEISLPKYITNNREILYNDNFESVEKKLRYLVILTICYALIK